MPTRIMVTIPTVRNPFVLKKYVSNAMEHRFPIDDLFFLILTEDFVDKNIYLSQLNEIGAYGDVLNQSDRERFLQERNLTNYVDVFPLRSHAETSFGLFYMFLKEEYEYGIFIDDDTVPIDGMDYFGMHVANLQLRGNLKCLSSSKKWVNVLHESFPKNKLYPRGYPYGAMNEKYNVETKSISNVFVSQGLWTNVPDLDAVRILADGDLNGQSTTRLSSRDYQVNFVADKGNFLTICSMNLAFRRQIIPAFYQFKMDDNPWRIGRFDDIWSGIVVKKVLDAHNYWIVNGRPLCEHNKAPRSTFKDLKSEAAGLEANEQFARTIDIAKLEGIDIMQDSIKIALQLKDSNEPFLSFNGKYFQKWLELLGKAA